MRDLLYVVAVILLIIWAVGYFGFQSGGLIHLLVVIALVVVAARIIVGRKPLG